MTLAVAVAGCGYFSQFHLEAWRRIDDVKVVALADANPNRLAEALSMFPQARPFADAKEMIRQPGIDLLDLVTPPATHLPLVRVAARVGVAVICQKPLAPTFAEAELLVAETEERGIVLAVHENFRFMPWIQEARKLIDAGVIGAPFNATFRLRPGDGKGDQAYLARQPYFRSMPRFLVHETGIHIVDVFRFLLGEMTGVFAKLKRLNPVIAGEDAGLIVFDFESGASGILDGNRHLDHHSQDPRLTLGTLRIEGDAGEIRLDGFGRMFVRATGSPEVEHSYSWNTTGFGGDCVYAQCRHVVDHLIGRGGLSNSGRAYLRNLEVEEAIYRSNQELQYVAI